MKVNTQDMHSSVLGLKLQVSCLATPLLLQSQQPQQQHWLPHHLQAVTLQTVQLPLLLLLQQQLH